MNKKISLYIFIFYVFDKILSFNINNNLAVLIDEKAVLIA
jgi:hypothetical protein